MAIHISRDFLTSATATSPTANIYFLSLFLTGVLGFTRIGQTNMNIFPSGSGYVSSGSGASINLGTEREYYCAVPTGSYIVPESSDNGKILVLKSTNYPRYNSGLFRVLSGSIADNAFILDYRTPGGVYPPIETGSLSGSLDWQLYAPETTFVTTDVYTDNGSGSNFYRANGSATYPRAIYRSPHSSSWQLRICVETSVDAQKLGAVATIAPGVDGNSAGDFSSRGEHLHGPLWWNDSEVFKRTGQVVSIDSKLGAAFSWITGRWRVFMWGDDQTGTFFIAGRNVTVGTNMWAGAGIPEPDTEPLPLPARTIGRLWSFGIAKSLASDTHNVTWNISTASDSKMSGMAFSVAAMQPVSLRPSSYHTMYNNTAPRQNVTADNAMLSATDLIPVELLAGTWYTNYSFSNPFQQGMILDPRRMGLVPMARQGRSNFGDWTISTDTNRTWFHLQDGVYFPWSGPTVLP